MAGMMEMDGMGSHWGVYFAVDNCTQAVERAVELGASVIRGPFSVDDTGMIAVLTDPQGAVINLIHMAQYDEPPHAD